MSSAPLSTNGVHHATDEAIDMLYAWMPPQAAPQPCPEALFSLTLKGTIDGVDALLTVRGMTAAEFQGNLAAMRGLLDAPTPASPQGQDETPQCQAHGALRKGKRGWYCPHKLEDDTWCKSTGR